ncbi:conserved hypothetical protein [uncultured Gammaproteobacteria bacterium]
MTPRQARVKVPAHSWEFKARFRAGVYSWRSSDLAAKRLKEAVSEIKKVAKSQPLVAAEGIIGLFARIWPAFQNIDTSSGRLGGAINKAVGLLIPILIGAPAPPELRENWLEHLFQAVIDDGVQYLWEVEERWGEIAVYPEIMNKYADMMLAVIRLAWTDERPGCFVSGSSICFSCLLEVGRYDDLYEILALNKWKHWVDQRYAAEALVRQGRIDAAVAFAEGCRKAYGQYDYRISSFCERVLIAAGHADKAYDRYAMRSTVNSTNIATFKAVADRYPGKERRKVLLDLITSHGERGKWFAAAKDSGFLDIALDCAADAEPSTLARAARDFASENSPFAMAIALTALQCLVIGRGYDPTAADLAMAFDALMAAAEKLGCTPMALDRVRKIATLSAAPGREFMSAALLRKCGASL